MAFQISVIVPVFNAARFVIEAVVSALSQPETAEVILIEDGSKDNSLEVCNKLAERFEKVILLNHPDNKNLGAAATRNLGMRRARYDYIAFLDADDYYLPGRFKVTEDVFEGHPDCDGVYEALGIKFEDEKAKEIWMSSPMEKIEMTTMSKVVEPNELFERLLIGNLGYFSLDGLTLSRSVIEKVGLFNEDLLLHEDTEYSLRLAAVACLLPGRLNEPVAVRRVHSTNRISAPISIRKDYRNHMAMWISTYRWLKTQKLSEKQALLFHRMVSKSINFKHYINNLDKCIPKSILTRLRLFLTTVEYPELLLEPGYFSKYLPGKKTSSH